MKKQNDIFLNKLKSLTCDKTISDTLLKKIIESNNDLLIKENKCKVCNKKYSSNNMFYGSSCLKNLYKNINITYSKDIDNKELFLHSAIVLKLGKINTTKNEMKYICESYLSKLYFNKFKYLNIKNLNKEIDNCISKNKKPIMKLNTAYRIAKIIKNNKLFSNITDDKIDETILKSLKHYFTIIKTTNTVTYEVYYYMQFIIWELVVVGGLLKKYNLASKCLSNSLSIIGENPKNMNISNTDKEVIDLIKNDSGFKIKLKYIISKYGINNTIDFNEDKVSNKNDVYYSFEKGDLFYSLHSVKINLKGTKNNNKWNLNILLIDTYDFTEILSNNNLKPGTVLNDMAAISSQYGVIKPYDITINFDWSDFSD